MAVFHWMPFNLYTPGGCTAVVSTDGPDSLAFGLEFSVEENAEVL